MTPEQQAMIDQAAKEHAESTCTGKQYGGTTDVIVVKIKEWAAYDFEAGASFYAEKILPGMMAEFAEWIDKNGWVKTDAGHWSDYNDNRCTLEEVITNFLEHLKHNQDAG